MRATSKHPGAFVRLRTLAAPLTKSWRPDAPIFPTRDRSAAILFALQFRPQAFCFGRAVRSDSWQPSGAMSLLPAGVEINHTPESPTALATKISHNERQ